MHFHFGVADCVLLAARRNYSADIARHPLAGQIPPIYYDTGVALRLDDGLRAERPFQVCY